MSAYDPTTQNGRRQIANDHSALMTDSFLWTLLQGVPIQYSKTPEVEFLKAVELYQQHHAPVKRWDLALFAFEALPVEPATLLGFYVLNYRALALRNHAPSDGAKLDQYFGKAIDAASELPHPYSHLGLGFVWFNQAVWLQEWRSTKDALLATCGAMQQRIAWFEYVRRHNDRFDPMVLAAAAEQVRKVYEVSGKWFPHLDRIAMFCITSKLIEEATELAPGDRSRK